jgi:hypothetical protein
MAMPLVRHEPVTAFLRGRRVAGQLDDVALDVRVGGLQSTLAHGVERLKESRLLRGRQRTEVLTSLIWAVDELIEPALTNLGGLG